MIGATVAEWVAIAALLGAGVALGLAAQGLIRDLLGGLTLIVDPPFRVGDRVRIGEHRGEVVGIGLRSVGIRTLEDVEVTIPNGRVISDPVANDSGGRPGCRVVTDLWLPADADLGVARRIGYEAAVSSRFVSLDRPVEVVVESEFRETFLLRVRVKAHVADHGDEPRFRTDVVEGAMEELRRRGIVTRELVTGRRPAIEAGASAPSPSPSSPSASP